MRCPRNDGPAVPNNNAEATPLSILNLILSVKNGRENGNVVFIVAGNWQWSVFACFVIMQFAHH